MKLTKTRAELLLVVIILVRSTSFVMSKIALNELNTFNLLAIRFTLAFIFLLPFCFNKLIKLKLNAWIDGALIALALIAVMACEVTGLKTANASSVVFIENTSIVLVPLFNALLTFKFPSIKNIFAFAIALTGVALLTLKDGQAVFNFEIGELFALAAAVLYAWTVLLIDKFSHKDDPIALGVLQLGFVGLFAAILAFIFETPIIPVKLITWQVILMLVIFCSCFGFALQPLAQSKTTAERTALLWSLSPVGGALSGYIFLGENIKAAGLAGMALILLAMLLANFKIKFK